MKPVHWLALGSAIGGCTVALGFHIMVKEAPADPSAPPAGGSRLRSGAPAKRHLAEAAAPGRAGSVNRPEARMRQESRSPETGFRIQGNPPAGLVTEESVWFANAERVEREAIHELETLRESLELSPYQEQRIFDILARRSSSWMPGMDTGAFSAADLPGAGDTKVYEGPTEMLEE